MSGARSTAVFPRRILRPWPAIAAVALAVLGLLVGAHHAPSTARAATTCDRFASPTGSEASPGTFERPFASVQRLADSLRPGETGCLREGTWQEDVFLRRGGASDARVTLRSYPGEEARIIGQMQVRGDHVTVEGLELDGSGAPACGSAESCTIGPSPVIYGDDARFSDNDVTNHNKGICFIVGSTSRGTAYRTVLEHNRIHGCGRKPATNHDHGIYVENAADTKIEHNLIYDNVDRGIQFYPDAVRSTARHNVIDGNGQGILFAHRSAGNVVENNVITNSQLRYNVESFEVTGGGNVVRSNCVSGGRYSGAPAGSGIQSPQVGFTAASNLHADPLYADRSDRDLRLRDSSPCRTLLGETDPGPRAGASSGDTGEGGPGCDTDVAPLGGVDPGPGEVGPEVGAPDAEGDDDSPEDGADEGDEDGADADGGNDEGADPEEGTGDGDEGDEGAEADEGVDDADGGDDDATSSEGDSEKERDDAPRDLTEEDADEARAGPDHPTDDSDSDGDGDGDLDSGSAEESAGSSGGPEVEQEPSERFEASAPSPTSSCDEDPSPHDSPGPGDENSNVGQDSGGSPSEGDSGRRSGRAGSSSGGGGSGGSGGASKGGGGGAGSGPDVSPAIPAIPAPLPIASSPTARTSPGRAKRCARAGRSRGRRALTSRRAGGRCARPHRRRGAPRR